MTRNDRFSVNALYNELPRERTSIDTADESNTKTFPFRSDFGVKWFENYLSVYGEYLNVDRNKNTYWINRLFEKSFQIAMPTLMVLIACFSLYFLKIQTTAYNILLVLLSVALPPITATASGKSVMNVLSLKDNVDGLDVGDVKNVLLKLVPDMLNTILFAYAAYRFFTGFINNENVAIYAIATSIISLYILSGLISALFKGNSFSGYISKVICNRGLIAYFYTSEILKGLVIAFISFVSIGYLLKGYAEPAVQIDVFELSMLYLTCLASALCLDFFESLKISFSNISYTSYIFGLYIFGAKAIIVGYAASLVQHELAFRKGSAQIKEEFNKDKTAYLLAVLHASINNFIFEHRNHVNDVTLAQYLQMRQAVIYLMREIADQDAVMTFLKGKGFAPIVAYGVDGIIVDVDCNSFPIDENVVFVDQNNDDIFPQNTQCTLYTYKNVFLRTTAQKILSSMGGNFPYFAKGTCISNNRIQIQNSFLDEINSITDARLDLKVIAAHRTSCG